MAGSTEALAAVVLSASTLFLFSQLPLTSLALLGLWAFPLTAALRQRHANSAATWNWAYLEPLADTARVPRITSLKPRLALGIGLAGALVYCVLLLITRIVWRVAAPESSHTEVDQRTAIFYVTVVMGIIVQMAVAALTAGRIGRLKVVHGLGAAFVSGCLMAAGALALNLLFGGSIMFAFAWVVFASFVNVGTVFALAAAFVASALRGWSRRVGTNWSDRPSLTSHATGA